MAADGARPRTHLPTFHWSGSERQPGSTCASEPQKTAQSPSDLPAETELSEMRTDKSANFSDFYLQHLTCRFCKDPKRGFSSSCSMFSATARKYFWRMKIYNKGHECPNKIPTVPIDWMVKAHVVQTIRGTRGHNSLGAVCSPTVWTLVAHTPSISIMLSDNFVLNRPGTENSDTQCEAWALGKDQMWNNFTYGSCTP